MSAEWHPLQTVIRYRLFRWFSFENLAVCSGQALFDVLSSNTAFAQRVEELPGAALDLALGRRRIESKA